MSEIKKNKEAVIGLDALRFLAAFIVMWYHLAHATWYPEVSSPKVILNEVTVNYKYIEFISWFGWVGVEIFFVISGFVIAFSAANSNWSGFLKGRVVRLYPSAVLGASLAAVVILFYNREEFNFFNYLRSVFIWPFGPWIDGVYWTLSVEIIFYSVVCLLIFLNKKDKICYAISVLGLMSLLLYVVCFVLAMTGNYNYVEKIFKTTSLVKLSLIAHGVFFALGVRLYFAHSVGWRVKIKDHFWLFLFVIGGCLEIIISTPMKSGKSIYMGMVPALLFLIGIAIIILSSYFSNEINKLTSNNFKKYVRLIGLTTYPLYLTHTAVGSGVLGSAISNGFNEYSSLAAAIISSILVSLIIAKYYEPYAQKYVKNKLDKIS